jgi:hypothetical protein
VELKASYIRGYRREERRLACAALWKQRTLKLEDSMFYIYLYNVLVKNIFTAKDSIASIYN